MDSLPSSVRDVVDRLASSPAVLAVVATGSHAHGTAGPDSDFDLFVYADRDLDDVRRSVAKELADGAHPILIDVDPFGSGDVWRSRDGVWLDIVYWSPRWASGQLDRALVHHEPSLGYSTAFWRSIAYAKPLYERDEWHPDLQQRAAAPYPSALADAIVNWNLPWLADHPFSFGNQIANAVERADVVSVNHRLAAWLASYFDIVFAANRILHPGEKRIVEFAEGECNTIPDRMRADIEIALRAEDPLPAIGRLTDGIRQLI